MLWALEMSAGTLLCLSSCGLEVMVLASRTGDAIFSFYMGSRPLIASFRALAHADMTVSESLKLTSLTSRKHFRLFEGNDSFFSKVVLIIPSRAGESCVFISQVREAAMRKILAESEKGRQAIIKGPFSAQDLRKAVGSSSPSLLGTDSHYYLIS